VLLLTYPLTFWEYDGLLFGAGVTRFEPLLHHPHPPGYPVYIALGKLFNLPVHDPFAALVALSIVSTLVGFAALAAAFRNLLHDGWLGVGGAVLFYGSAGMLVHATLPLSDATGLAFLALAVLQVSRRAPLDSRRAILFGLFASLAVGCRPQLAAFVLPLLLLVLMDAPGRARAMMLGAFAIVSLAWFVPLVIATGGPAGFVRYEFGQAADFAANDANLARSGWSGPALLLRFLAHPWGPKLLSAPVLAAALVGASATVLNLERRLGAVAMAGALYLALAIAGMDPADGVRYALPGTMTVALLAARGLGTLSSNRVAWRKPTLAVVLGCAAAAASLRYAGPVVLQRHASPSPPAQAARYARSHLPSNTVILYDLSLRPHAEQLLASFASRPLGPDFGTLADRPDVPVVVFADGASDASDAVDFAWDDSDAYGKLTRNHYRVVSLIPAPPERRYRAVRGVYPAERTPEGRTWRWLAPSAELALPDVGANRAVLRLGLPDDYPWDLVGVTLQVDGARPLSATVRRGDTVPVTLVLAGGPSRVDIDADRTFVPANAPRLLQRDARALGVMLVDVEQVR
jgi:hypothetical protein